MESHITMSIVNNCKTLPMCMVNDVLYIIPTIMSNGMIYKNTCYSITEQIVNTKKVGFLFSNMNIAFNIHFKEHTIGQVLYHYIPLIIYTTKKYMFLLLKLLKLSDILFFFHLTWIFKDNIIKSLCIVYISYIRWIKIDDIDINTNNNTWIFKFHA